jgi:hypothetical protein
MNYYYFKKGKKTDTGETVENVDVVTGVQIVDGAFTIDFESI